MIHITCDRCHIPCEPRGRTDLTAGRGPLAAAINEQGGCHLCVDCGLAFLAWLEVNPITSTTPEVKPFTSTTTSR